MLMDTSAISVVDLGESFENFAIEKERKRKTASTDFAFRTVINQSRVQHKQTWAYESLDLVLGLVGGLAGVIWTVL